MAIPTGYATSGVGPYTTDIAWLNFGQNFTISSATTPQTITNTLDNGYTITFTVSVTGGNVPLKAYNNINFAFSNTGYQNMTPDTYPILYSSAVNLGTATVHLTNISVQTSSGENVTNYDFIMADAEVTGASWGEIIQYQTNVEPIYLLGMIPQSNYGPPTMNGLGTNNVLETPTGAGSQAPVLYTSPPQTVDVTITTRAYEGIAFGLLIPRPTKTVTPTAIYGAQGTQPVTFTVNFPLLPTINNTPSNTYTFEDIIDPRLSVVSHGVDLTTSGPYYTLVDQTSGNHIKYVLTTNIPPDQAGTLPEFINLTVETTYTSPKPTPTDSIVIPNTATVKVNTDEPMSSNTVDLTIYPINPPVKSVVPSSINYQSTDLITYAVDYPIPSAFNTTPTTINLVDQIDSQLTIVSHSLNLSPSPYYTVTDISSGQTINYKIVTNIPSGQTGNLPNPIQLTIVAQLASTTTAPNTIPNTATMQFNHSPIIPSNTANVMVLESADLSVMKTANPTTVIVGQPLTYTIEVSNHGPSDAQNVSLTDTVPTQLSSVEFSLDGGQTYNPWISPYLLGTVASSTSLSILIRGTVNSSTIGTLTNTATVTSPTPDPDPDNNTSTATVEVTPSADLSVIKTGSPTSVIPGHPLTYTIVVHNEGPSDAQNVSLTDVIPNQLSNVEFSTDGGKTYNPWISPYLLGTVISGTSLTILIQGTVNSSTIAPLTNTATVTSSTPDPNLDNNSSTATTEVTLSADLSIVKTASNTSIGVGQLLTYTLILHNDGPSDAQNVSLADTVPTHLSNVEFSLDGGKTYNPWVSPYLLGTVTSGTSLTILIRGTVNSLSTDTLTNTATVTSPTPDPNPNNNVSSVTVQVTTDADLSIIKTANLNPVKPGDILTYTLIVHNDGPSDAEQVSITDFLSSQLSGAEFSIDGGKTYHPWVNPYLLGTLKSGTSLTILIRAKITACAAGTICNTASIHSATLDLYPANNTSKVIVQVTPIPRTQAITDVLESVALVESGLAHILNAEGEKIQKIVAMNETIETMIQVNKSVECMVNSISLLEIALRMKLEIFSKK